MATNYAKSQLTTAIKNHLMHVNAIPPTAEVPKLASELAQVCLTELNAAGVSSETVEKLFAPIALKAKARGVD